MLWFCWLMVGAFGSYIIMLILGFIFSRKIQKQKNLEGAEDIILYDDVVLLIYAQKGDQVKTVWDISKWEEENLISVQIIYDDIIIGMMPEDVREAFNAETESFAIVPHASVWQQGGNFGWCME